MGSHQRASGETNAAALLQRLKAVLRSNEMIPSDIFTAYFNMGQILAGKITPYALHLLYLLLIVETVTIGVTYVMGSDDPPELLWRLLRLIFTGGFAYWWIVNSWALGLSALGGFNEIGVALTGNPKLTPTAFINVAVQLGKILWDAPSSARLIPNIALALGDFLIAIIILLVLLTVACLAIFTLAAGYLIIGPGSIVIALLPCRFTAPLAEGYFTWLVRTGMLILFFYIVLGVAQNFVQLWTTTLATTCAARITTVPIPTLVGPPIIRTAYTCTAPIPGATLLTLLADVLVLGFIAIGIPFIAGSIVAHGVSMALEHFAAAKYLTGSALRPVAHTVGNAVRQAFHTSESHTQSKLEQRLAAGAAAAAMNPRPQSQTATQRLPKSPSSNAFGVQRTQGLPQGSGARSTTKI
jgi:P-type conjugative transfer protein TrbL